MCTGVNNLCDCCIKTGSYTQSHTNNSKSKKQIQCLSTNKYLDIHRAKNSWYNIMA